MKTVKIIVRECAWLSVILIAVVLHVSVIANFSWLATIVHIPLLCSHLLVALRFPIRGVYFAAISAYYIDMGSVLPFGFFLIVTVFSVAVMIFFQKNIFKNYAAHALVLNVGIAMSCYMLVFGVFYYLIDRFSLAELSSFSISQFTSFALIQTISHIILVTLFFIVIAAVSKRYPYATFR